MVDLGGIEPPPRQCECRVIPLYYRPLLRQGFVGQALCDCRFKISDIRCKNCGVILTYYRNLVNMFKIRIIALGKFKEKAYKELEAEFLKRLHPYAKLKIIEIPEVPYRGHDDIVKVKEKEAEKIIAQLPEGGIVILLEEKGTVRDSKTFADFLQRTGGLGKELVFVIGSGIGLSDVLKPYSNYSISLSPLTFPHNMARVILEEQIYRACTILAGKEYHK